MDKLEKEVEELNEYKEKLQKKLVDFIAAEPDPELQKQMIDQLKET